VLYSLSVRRSDEAPGYRVVREPGSQRHVTIRIPRSTITDRSWMWPKEQGLAVLRTKVESWLISIHKYHARHPPFTTRWVLLWALQGQKSCSSLGPDCLWMSYVQQAAANHGNQSAVIEPSLPDFTVL
jgi:hypothetical protein